MRSSALALLFGITLQSALAAASEPSCTDEAIRILKQNSSHGYRVYLDRKDRKFFSRFLDCDDIPNSLSTAVHESVHTMWRRSRYREHPYYLPDGTWAKVEFRDLFHREELLQDLGGKARPNNSYDESYLASTGNQDITMVLEELNAYIHDLIVTKDLAPLMPGTMQVSGRDGLATFMHYLKLYLHRAKVKHPRDWEEISGSQAYVATIRAMWSFAEKALREACPIPRIGIRDQVILGDVYAPESAGALEELLGAPLKRPGECPSPTPRSPEKES